MSGGATILVHATTQAGNRGLACQQAHRGDPAERDDQFRLYQLDLALQVRLACQRFFRLGVAVARRPAFDDVGDVDIRATPQLDRRQHAVEELPGLSHERLALRVLVRTGAFAHEEPARPLVADAEYGARALRMQLAIRAPRHASLERAPVHLHDARTALLAHG